MNRNSICTLLAALAPFLSLNMAQASQPTIITHVPLYTFYGDASDDRFGWSVRGAGDVNGDGHTDLVAGAPFADKNGTDSGSARVFSGLDGSTLYTFNGDSPGDNFGISVSSAGDVNGDGRADLIVGARFDDNNGLNSGSARVFSGLDGSTLYTFDGDGSYDRFGFSVSGTEDVNGDGISDLIVGAHHDDNTGTQSGSTRVFSGLDGSTLYTFNGDNSGDEFGHSVHTAGDVNGDGRGDLIVGAYFDDNSGPNSGSARVLSGLDGTMLYNFNGDSSNDYFGFSVSGAGDVNADGRADLIVGAVFDDNNGSGSGSARVFSGADGSVLYTFSGDNVNDQLGISVSGVGDVNADGRADLIVGVWGSDNNGLSSGSVRVMSGIDGSPLYTFDGDSSLDGFGHSVSGAGDINGDGIADFIVGASRGGQNGGGYARVFVSQVTVIPEPTAIALLALGGLLLAGWRHAGPSAASR